MPAVRSIDVTSFRTPEDELYFSLRDPTRVADRPLALSPPAYFILMHCDGMTPLRTVQEAFGEQFGQPLTLEDAAHLLGVLDEALMLRTPRFAAALHARHAEYAAAPARDNRAAWPAATELESELRDLLSAGRAEDGIGAGATGLIAPHLDYERGKPCYADAFAALRQAAPAERYVILGTNHFGESRSVVATRKDFLTPFGLAPTDRSLIQRIESRLGWSICEREFDHFAEHSVELQVHLLQLLAGGRPFEIVPVLCPDPSGPTGTKPSDGQGPDLADFANALREALAADGRATVLIASADLSHVGQHFGDAQATTPEFLERVAASDRGLLDLLAARRPDEFADQVRRTENWSRICSVGCLFTLLKALPEGPCRVMRYHQAVNMPEETHVTCAAGILA